MLKKIYYFCVVLFSGYSTVISNEIGLILLFLLGVIINYDLFSRIPKKILILLAFWFIYFLINFILVGEFHPYFFLTFIIYICIVWFVVGSFGNSLFERYEDIVYILSLISLVFFVLQIINYEFLYTIFDDFNLNYTGKNKSLLFYTIHWRSQPDEIPRNCGFTWEPGPFACYIVLAMYFNIARHGAIFMEKNKMFIYIVTLITTQSTTGMVMMFILVVWYFMFVKKNKIVYKKPFIIIIILCVGYVGYNKVPYLGSKISLESEQNLENEIDESYMYNFSKRPGRFASLEYGIMEFMENPVSGYGGHMKYRLANKNDVDIYGVGGLGNMLAQYGLIGFILYFMSVVRSSAWLKKHYIYKGKYIYLLLLTMISFSFNVMTTPLMVIMWMFVYFIECKDVSIRDDIVSEMSNK